MPLPEQTQLELDAIDAALAGEAVDPQFAELAELALMLADTKPVLTATGAAALDRRFATTATHRPGRTATATAVGRRRAWFRRPVLAGGLGLALALGLAVLVVGLTRGGSPDVNGPLTPDAAGPARLANETSTSAASAASGASGGSSKSPASSGSSQSRVGSPATAGASLAYAPPTPQSNGRRIVQSSQLSLSTPGARLATVSEELFDVIGTEQGIVNHSEVTSGANGYASFTLQVPTRNLPATLTRLAQLRYATVASSTSSTTDVNSQYLDDQRKLTDAKALRTSLLNQLQAAVTIAAIDSLKAQLQDAESSIAGDEATLNRLQSRISYSGVDVQINSAEIPARRPTRGGGFSFARAPHDALDVLKVTAGVGLIGLAGFVPLGLLAVVIAWLTLSWRRHRRERALDAG